MNNRSTHTNSLRQNVLAVGCLLGEVAYNGAVVDMAAIGEAIRVAREAKKWGQKELSAATVNEDYRIAISSQAISEIETGLTTDPRIGTLARLCKALSLSVEIRPDGSATIGATPERLSNVGAFLSAVKVTPEIAGAVVVLAFAALNAVGHSVDDRPPATDRPKESEGGEHRPRLGGQDPESV